MTTWPPGVAPGVGQGVDAGDGATPQTRRLSLQEGADSRSAAPRLVAFSTMGAWAVSIYPNRILGHVDVHIGRVGRSTLVIAGFKPTGRGSLFGFGGQRLADAFHAGATEFAAVCEYLVGMPAEHERLADAVAIALANGWPTADVDSWLASEQADDIATAVRSGLALGTPALGSPEGQSLFSVR